MAIETGKEPEAFTLLDPTEEAVIRRFNVRVRHPFSFDADQGEVIYDRPSDTVLILPYGRDRASFAFGVDDYLFVLVDPDTDEVIGIQIEDFLHCAVKDEPGLIRLLDVADLQGMTVEDVRRERHRALGYWGRFKLWLERMAGAIARRGESNEQNVVDALVYRGRVGSTIRNALGSA